MTGPETFLVRPPWMWVCRNEEVTVFEDHYNGRRVVVDNAECPQVPSMADTGGFDYALLPNPLQALTWSSLAAPEERAPHLAIICGDDVGSLNAAVKRGARSVIKDEGCVLEDWLRRVIEAVPDGAKIAELHVEGAELAATSSY